MMANSVTVLEKFSKDETFSVFLDNSFTIHSFISNSIDHHQLANNSAKIQQGISLLQSEINTQVNSQNEELLDQVNVIQSLEKMVQEVDDGVTVLEQTIQLVQKELNKPYENMKKQLADLERIQSAMEIFRKVKYFWEICSKLKSHFGMTSQNEGEQHKKTILPTTRELPNAAIFLFELEKIGKDPDLKGIELVDHELDWIHRVHQEIHTKSMNMLSRGLETQNQLEVANSLQVFDNLHCLSETVQQTINIIEENIVSSIRGVLDFSSLFKKNTTQPTSQQIVEWKAILWTRLEKFVDGLYQNCVQIWHLQRILIFQEFKITCNDFNAHSLASAFWTRFTILLKKELSDAADNSAFIESTFINDYSRLISIFSEFLKRLQSHHEVKQGKTVELEEETEKIMKALERFEKSYLSSVMDRIAESIRKAFPKPTILPTSDDIIAIAKVISIQIDISQNIAQLITPTITCLSKAVEIFIHHAQTAVTEVNDQTVADKLAAAQVRNGKLYNAVYMFYDQLSRTSSRSSSHMQHKLKAPIQIISNFANRILELLFQQQTNQVEKIILTMYNTDYNLKSLDPAKDEGSPFIKLLQRQLTNFVTVILPSYTNTPIVASHLQKLIDHILVYFVRHASLVRPVSNHGKLKLAGDVTQLESVLVSLRSSKLAGNAYNALRAFKPFMFRELDQIRGAPELDKLQPVDVLHHLICRGPIEIKLPHELLGWSASKYSAWLDTVQYSEVWKLVQQSLESYARQVDSRGAKQYDPIYPLICELGPALEK